MLRPIIATLLATLALEAAASAQSAAQVPPSQARELNLSAYAELLRSDVRTQKIAILTQVMGFTDAEDDAFWPIYRAYDTEMSRLGDERVTLLEDYARSFDAMTDEVAEQLASRALDLERRRQATLTACFDRVRHALSPRTALRFLQVEHQLLLLIDLQIASALPIID